MTIKIAYDGQDDIPESFRELYEEQGGKWILTGVEGIKTQQDVDRVSLAATKERQLRESAEKKLKIYEGIDPEKVAQITAELEEARVRLEGLDGKNADQEAITLKRIEAAVAREIGPLQRKHDQIKSEREDLAAQLQALDNQIRSEKIRSAIRAAAMETGVRAKALEDVELRANLFEIADDGRVVTKTNAGVTPGLTADAWLADQKTDRQHWFEPSVGGRVAGSTGSQLSHSGPNPYMRATWNLTEQGRVETADRNKANALAQAAGFKDAASALSPPPHIKK